MSNRKHIEPTGKCSAEHDQAHSRLDTNPLANVDQQNSMVSRNPFSDAAPTASSVGSKTFTIKR
jgi:hypothetical protein